MKHIHESSETPVGIMRDYRPAFDGLRAVSVAAVMLAHLDSSIFKNGGVGVDVFFVLSGYLITGILAKESDSTGGINLRNFYVRRLLRLVPALWLVLAFMLGWFLMDPESRRGTLGSIVAAATYIMNWNMIYNWMGLGMLGHTWSLAVEEQFYLLWPAALFIIPRRLWLTAAVLGASGSAACLLTLSYFGAGLNRLYLGLDCHIVTLLVGAACILKRPDAFKGYSRFQSSAALLAAAGLVTLFLHKSTAVQYGTAIDMLGATALSAILIVLVDAGAGQGLLSLPPIVAAGRRSYGIYLWHSPVLGLLKFYGVTGLWLTLMIPITLAIAWASFRFVERPMLKLKDRLASGNAV